MSEPGDAPRGTVCCGPLRREPDGSWYYRSKFLGRDGEPATSLYEVEDTVGVVAMLMGEALTEACRHLYEWGNVVQAERGRGVLRRFARWQTTGRW